MPDRRQVSNYWYLPVHKPPNFNDDGSLRKPDYFYPREDVKRKLDDIFFNTEHGSIDILGYICYQGESSEKSNIKQMRPNQEEDNPSKKNETYDWNSLLNESRRQM